MKWLQFLSIIPMFLLCQCGTPSPPHCWKVPPGSKRPAPNLIAEARTAWQQLGRQPSRDARRRYNLATARLFDQLRCGKPGLEQKAAKIGTQIDRSRTLGTGLKLEDLEALVPADKVSLEGIGQRHLDDGLGVPVVGWKSAQGRDDRQFEFAPPSGLPLNLTAYLDFSQQPPAWNFRYGGRQGVVKIGRRSEPMAVDWSAPAALYWRMSDLDDFDFTKVILPTRFTDHAGLFFATPYSSKKIPVVFVHGLNSSPGTYKALYNDLIGQNWFRDKYQVLFFSYPTGIAWPYNAAEFRRQLRRAGSYAADRGSLDNWNRMVVVGHSMGGVISRASLVDPGTRFYEASYRAPVDQLRVSPATRQAIKSVRLYEPLKAPSRAIFMAAPHRGSPMADRPIFMWFRSLIRLPKTLTVDFATATLSEITMAIQQGGQTRPPLTSIGTLSPRYRPYGALSRSPFRRGLKFHTILGDRGRQDSPESSDGIVPYWSSNIPGAQSVKIVPAGHSLVSHPETIREVSRLLLLHLRDQ